MPIAIFERNESRSTDSCDWPGARIATLGKQLPEAVSAVGFFVSRGEPLSSQASTAIGAAEALSMPGFVSVSYTTTGDDRIALDTPGREFFLVASSAINVVITRYKALGTNRVPAHAATEAFLVPLMPLIFHLLCSCSEDFTTAIATGGERGIVTIGAVNLLGFGSERLVN